MAGAQRLRWTGPSGHGKVRTVMCVQVDSRSRPGAEAGLAELLPTFLVIGAGRCGTTTLCAILDSHPDVFMCDPKEPGFFSNDSHYAHGLAWYAELFRESRGKTAIGEGTVDHSKRHIHPQVAERLARDLPDARLIYIVRHPLDQIRSNWSYRRVCGVEPRSFKDAVVCDPDYMATCHYAWQLEAFHSAYGRRDNLLLLFMEDMKRDQVAVARQAFEFIGVPPDRWDGSSVHMNAAESAHGLNAFANLVRGLPAFHTLRRYVPRPARRLWNRLLSVQHTIGDATWQPEALREVLPIVRERATDFLRENGKPTDFWSFDRYEALVAERPATEPATHP